MTDLQPFDTGDDLVDVPRPEGKGKEKAVAVRRNRPEDDSPVASVDTPPRVPVRLAVMKIKTSTLPDVAYDVDLVVKCLRKADEYFRSRSDHNPHELRILVGPEWFFRRVGNPYSHRELNDIVAELRRKTGTDEFRSWLVIPGTIYFGLGYDHRITTDDDLDNVRREIEHYFTIPMDGSPPPVRPEPAAPVQWFVGNVAVAVCQGNVMGYHFKTFQQDIDESRQKAGNPIERWAMDALSLERRLVLCGMPFIRIPGLGVEIALEICRDHNQMTDRVYYGSYFDGPGTHIHIVMCYGVEFRKVASVARNGGFYIRCNGAPEIQVTKVESDMPPVPPADVVGIWRAGEDMPAYLEAVGVRQERLQTRQATLKQEKKDLKQDLRKKHFWQDKSQLRSQIDHKKRQIAVVTGLINEAVSEMMQRSSELRRGFEGWERAGVETFKPKSAKDSGTLGKEVEFDIDHGGKLVVWEGKMQLDVRPLSQVKQ